MTSEPPADDATWKRAAFERHRREELLHFIALSPTEKLRLLVAAIEFVRSARWPDRDAERHGDRDADGEPDREADLEADRPEDRTE